MKIYFKLNLNLTMLNVKQLKIIFNEIELLELICLMKVKDLLKKMIGDLVVLLLMMMLKFIFGRGILKLIIMELKVKHVIIRMKTVNIINSQHLVHYMYII